MKLDKPGETWRRRKSSRRSADIMVSTVLSLAGGLLLISSPLNALDRGEGGEVLSELKDCANSISPLTCLKTELAGVLGRALRTPSLELLPGVKLVSEETAAGSVSDQTEELPRHLDEDNLDSLITSRIWAFFKSHSLQFNLSQLPRSFGVSEEGRSKRRRGAYSLLMMFLWTASMMLPLKMGTLALLAGKALIIAKLALALAVIVGLKKILSGDEHQDSYQVVTVPAHGHIKRSLDYLHLPYRAYQPSL